MNSIELLSSQYRIWMVYHIPLERGKLVIDRDKYPTDSMWFQEESTALERSEILGNVIQQHNNDICI